MRINLLACLFLALLPGLVEARSAYMIDSPDRSLTVIGHENAQRTWVMRGKDHHLAVVIQRLNGTDEVVEFNFPKITLEKDGNTFYYQTPEGTQLRVARQNSNAQGVKEINLLPNCLFYVRKTKDGESYMVRLHVCIRDLSNPMGY